MLSASQLLSLKGVAFTQIIIVCVIVDLLDLLFAFYFIVSFFVSTLKHITPFELKWMAQCVLIVFVDGIPKRL
jgi:hypothetical protein